MTRVAPSRLDIAVAWPLHSCGSPFSRRTVSHAAAKNSGMLESFVADNERDLVDHARLDGHGEVAGHRRSDLDVLVCSNTPEPRRD